MTPRKRHVDPRRSGERIPPSRNVLLRPPTVSTFQRAQRARENVTYPAHLTNVIQLLLDELGRAIREVVLVTPYHGRFVRGEPRGARVDIAHGASTPADVGDLDLGGAHHLAVDRLDALGRQLLDVVGQLQDERVRLALGEADMSYQARSVGVSMLIWTRTRTSSRSSNTLTSASGSFTSLLDVKWTREGMNPYRVNASTD